MSLPLPFLHCLCMGENGKRANSHRGVVYFSYQRVKEESSRQLMSVWLFHLKKNTTQTTPVTPRSSRNQSNKCQYSFSFKIY